MSARSTFRELMAERKACEKGSPDWDWRTRACRKYVWLMRGNPVLDWPTENEASA